MVALVFDLFAVVDDFASNIERQIANVLKKDRLQLSEEEKDEGKHSRKRKKKDKDKRKVSD